MARFVSHVRTIRPVSSRAWSTYSPSHQCVFPLRLFPLLGRDSGPIVDICCKPWSQLCNFDYRLHPTWRGLVVGIALHLLISPHITRYRPSLFYPLLVQSLKNHSNMLQ